MEKMKREVTKWEISVYVALSIIFIWLILKVTGVIHTPPWLEYGVPIASGLFAFLGLYRDLMEKFYTLRIEVVQMKSDIGHLDKDMEIVKKSLA